jgi:AraC-like DNA-binding protein
MARQQDLPIYDICSLSDAPSLQHDIIADHLGHYLEVHANLRFPHKHSFYHVVYFTKGAGGHSIDFVNFPVEKGQIYFMIPGQVHSWHFKETVDGYIINFSENYITSFIANHRYLDQFHFFSGNSSDQVIKLMEKVQREVESLFEQIISENNSDDEYKEDARRTAMIQLFIAISRTANKAGNQTNQYNSLLLRNFKKLIDSNYKTKKLTKEYAAMLYVTPNHLNALCKDVTGQSAGALIRNRVILEAKRLLINANTSISQIASELSFEDNSYFSKFFKKYVGVTPEIFRKEFETK